MDSSPARRRYAAVQPYVPDPAIPWEDINPYDAPLKLSCTGSFADERLNVEFRRFLHRDAAPLVVFVASFFTFGLANAAVLVIEGEGFDEFAAFPIAAIIGCGIFSIVEFVLFFRPFGPTSARDTMIRIACMMMYTGLLGIPLYLLQASRRVLLCGDVPSLPPQPTVNASGTASFNRSQSDTMAAYADAVGDRQQYCINVVDIQVPATVVVYVLVFRLLAIHALPPTITSAVMLMVGFAVRDHVLAKNEDFEKEGSTTAANALVLGACLLIGAIRSVRMNAVDRWRFQAAGAAERARRLAARELGHVDLLLTSALQPTVLERVTSGGLVRDQSEAVSVLFASLKNDALLEPRCTTAASIAAVETLHAVVSDIDAVLASGGRYPEVTKVKTVGDVYWAMAGLPLACPGHATEVCRFAFDIETICVRHSGAVRASIGVGSGAATAAIVGTDRLCYEPIGPVCDAAQVARDHSILIGGIIITDATRKQLMEDAFVGCDDSDMSALYPSPDAVDEAARPLPAADNDPDSPGYFTLGRPRISTTAAAAGTPRADVYLDGAAAERRSMMRHDARGRLSPTSASADAATELAQTSAAAPRATATSKPAATGGAAWVASTMQRREEQLEQQLDFLLSWRSRSSGHQGSTADAGSSTGNWASSSVVADGAANRPAEVKRLKDAQSGPLARSPAAGFLVYRFTDDAEEDLYQNFARKATHLARRDTRVATAVFFAGVVAYFGATQGLHVGLAGQSAALVVAVANAGGIVLQGRRFNAQSDTWMAHVAMVLFIFGVYTSDGNAIGNDVYWAYIFYCLTLSFHSIWTMSPRAQVAVNLVFNVACVLKLVIVGKGFYLDNFVTFVGAVICQPAHAVLSEKYSRRAFKERRLAEALLEQQRAATRVQLGVLKSLVPGEAVRPLRQWCAAGCSPVSAVTLTHDAAALVVLRLVPLPAQRHLDEQRHATVFDAHRTIDALLERCTVIEKVKTAGDTVIAWRPMAGCESMILPQLSGGDEPVMQTVCAALVSELLFVAESLESMGWGTRAALHVGPVVGAVLGTQRLSLDLLGPAADFALVACDVISGCEDAAADAGEVHEGGTVDFVNLPSDAARKMLTSDVVARRRAQREASRSAVAISYAFSTAAGFDEAYARLQVPTWSHAAEESVVKGASRVLSMASFEVLKLRALPAFPGCSAGALFRVDDWATPAHAAAAAAGDEAGTTPVPASDEGDDQVLQTHDEQEPMTPVA